MNKAIAFVAGIALAAGGAASVQLASPSDPVRAAATTTGDDDATSTAATTAAATTGREAGEDVRGPCDEAEHAGDPRCTGAAPATREAERDDDRGREAEPGDDRGRGAEPGDDHGADAAVTEADDDHGDRSGPSGDDDSDHGNDDRSGSNSGRD